MIKSILHLFVFTTTITLKKLTFILSNGNVTKVQLKELIFANKIIFHGKVNFTFIAKYFLELSRQKC